MCPPGNRLNQEIFALVKGKNKKNLNILDNLLLKGVNFEVFAQFIA